MSSATVQVTLVDRPCPVCGSEDRSNVLVESTFDPARLDRFAYASRKLPEYMHHRLIACPTCDLVYASPAPTDDSLIRSYEASDYDSAGEARMAARTYEQLVRPLLGRLPDREGAVDIGAGDGAFLERLIELDFTSIVGFEPSGAAIAAADERTRRLIRHGPFTPDGLRESGYSLVTCFQTIEHLRDPLGVCRQVRSLLKEGGAFVVVCHDRRALSARVLGRRSPIFDIEHLQLFSASSVRALLERAGFRSITTSPIVNRYALSYWVKLAPLPIKRHFLRVLAATRAGGLIVPLPAGNLSAIGFR